MGKRIITLKGMGDLKVLFIAPLPPLRGGIPRHSYYLSLALKSLVDIEVWTPKKLFPNFLYPGKSQFENDSRLASYALSLADKKLSHMGIFLKLLNSTKQDFQIALLPWWTSYFAIQTLVLVSILKLKGITPAVICHNVVPHNSSRIEAAVSRFLIRKFDIVFVQSQSEFDSVKSLHLTAKCVIVNHPPYPTEHSIGKNRSRRVAKNSPVKVLFFGFIRDYKGIETLLKATERVNKGDFEFNFVGEPWSKNLEEKIRFYSWKNSQITHTLSYVDESIMVKIFDSSDVLVLPYSKATGSGALAIAKGLKIPVVISDSIYPGKEFEEGRDGLIFSSEESASLARTLISFRENQENFINCWAHIDHKAEWESVATKVISAMSACD